MTTQEICLIVATGTGTFAAIAGLVKFWITRSDRKLTQLVNTTRKELLTAMANNIERQFSNMDKSTYLTLDYRMDGDSQCLRIPLAYTRVTECLLGMRLQLVDHSEKETTYSVSTLGFGAPIRLHWHYHEEMEIIQVIRGTVVDVQTGRRYGPGASWVVEPEARHIADFDNAYALCTVRPPLPWASQHPINLSGVAEFYNSPPPKDLVTCGQHE
jgi:quercetin dioxygenase-like cupin family protein